MDPLRNAIDIQDDIITIEWNPPENDESFDAEFQRSLRLLTDGKLEDARFILEDLASILGKMGDNFNF